MQVSVVLEQCLAPVPGGTGRYSREIAAALARTAGPADGVAAWTAAHRDLDPARAAGVRGPRRLPLPRRALVAAWERGLPPRLPGDAVHAPTPLAPPPRRGQRLAVTVHDTVPWSHPETLTPRGVAWHRRAVASAVRTADLLAVPTLAVAGELTALFPQCAPRVRVVPEGVAADLRVPPDADERARRLRLPEGGYLVSLATLEPRKGLDVALRAVGHPDAPALPLLVVGQPGWGGLDLDRFAATAGLAADRFRLLGRLPDPDLAVVLDRAVALVAPSRAEGFGLPVLEAMALGTPVVTSDAPALVEVGGGATVVVPREDAAALAGALRDVADDRALHERLSRAGLARAAQFSWDDAARRLWAALR